MNRSLFVFIFALLGSLGSVAAQTPTATATKDYLALSRELLNKYYETQKLLSKEESDWKTGKEIIGSRLALMQAQLKELTEKTAEQQKTITTNDTEREKLDAQNKELLTTQDLQVSAIQKLEGRVHKLWPLLPEMLQEKIRGQYERLPKVGLKPEEIKSSVGERFVNVLIVINEVNKFHSDVTVVSERRKLASGRELEVRVIYFGLAAAYFAGSGETADVGGMLIPGEKGWEAIEDPKVAALVDEVISMNKGDKVAGFVSLPVKVR
ncbi:Protein of unknown function [Prosthecobacter debontii]|uniref:DUF3450 family protein n=1 Tax=Prosthecobacter debontii TaxID=48467 RepID=A0A1T4YSQ5_9BACT|nr:DUF3450 family protein [Prosthecobacter debontii]SKB04897.1 Protein of unknown function [Prosthecobacter debontii]